MIAASYISDYVEYCGRVTDAPASYYRGAAYFSLAATINGRVRIRMQWGDVKTNVWVMLLGRSTIDRKTTVIEDITLPIIMSVPDNIHKLASSDFTYEALVAEMAERNPSAGFIVRDEFAGLLSSLNKGYMDGAYDFIMKLFDGPQIYKRTLRSVPQPFIMNDVCVSMITGTTYRRLDAVSGKAEVYSGFLPRFLTITHVGERSCGGKSPRTAEDDLRRATLSSRLLELDRYLRINSVEFSLSEGAAEAFFGWVRRRESEITEDDDIAGIVFGRTVVYVLKLAMLEEISVFLPALVPDNSHEFPHIIRKETIDSVIAYLEGLERGAVDRFARIAADDSARIKEEIFERIRSAGSAGVAHHDLLRTVAIKRATFNDAIETLEEERRVSDRTRGLGGEPIYVAGGSG